MSSLWITFTAATINDDFTDAQTSADDVDADVLLLQEVKETNIRMEVSTLWGVFQNLTTKAKAGSAVVWKYSRASSVHRDTALGVLPRGAKMLARYRAEVVLAIKGSPHRVLFIACHRPPKRYRFLWAAFDYSLAKRTHHALRNRRTVIVGMDANQRDPRALARKCGLVWHGIGIDGFLVSPNVTVTHLHRLPKGPSDHHPVKALFTVRVGL